MNTTEHTVDDRVEADDHVSSTNGGRHYTGSLSLAFSIPRVESGGSTTTSASQVIQHLYTLDTSSPDFLRAISNLILHDENEQYTSSIQGPELTRLVDFLDEVCALPSASRRISKRSP